MPNLLEPKYQIKNDLSIDPDVAATTDDVREGKVYINTDKEILIGTGKLGTLQIDTIGTYSGHSAQTINVTKKYPDTYKNLQTTNFFIEPVSSSVSWGVYSLPNTSAVTWSFTKSYNPETGKLTLPVTAGSPFPGHLNGGLDNYTVYCVYVK